MKTINLFLFVFFILSFSSCKDKEFFVDEALLDEWTLEWHEDANGNKIHEKPTNLPQDIILVFRQGLDIGGQVASFSIEGTYSLEKDGSMALNLFIPRLPTCCQWDETFLESYSSVSRYEYNGGGYLRLYYDNGNKSVLFSN